MSPTSCACAECVSCCKRQAGPLAPGDLNRILDKLGIPRHDAEARAAAAREHFRASPGALIFTGRRTAQDSGIRRVGTIVPAMDKTGRCHFLTEDNRCSIHEVAPFGCRYFDMHMPSEVAAPRSAHYLRLIMDSPFYGIQRAGLPPAETHNPTFV